MLFLVTHFVSLGQSKNAGFTLYLWAVVQIINFLINRLWRLKPVYNNFMEVYIAFILKMQLYDYFGYYDVYCVAYLNIFFDFVDEYFYF